MIRLHALATALVLASSVTAMSQDDGPLHVELIDGEVVITEYLDYEPPLSDRTDSRIDVEEEPAAVDDATTGNTIGIGSTIGNWRIREDSDGRPFAGVLAEVEGEYDMLTLHCEEPFGYAFLVVSSEGTNGTTLILDPSRSDRVYHPIRGKVYDSDAAVLMGRLSDMDALSTGGPVMAEFVSTKTSPTASVFDVQGAAVVQQFMDDNCETD